MTGDEDRDIAISFRFSVFRQGMRRFSIAHPSILSRWEGKKYRLSNNLFPLPTGGGVGDPMRELAIQFRSALCSNTDILYAMSIARGFKADLGTPGRLEPALARAEAAPTPVSRVARC